MDLTKLNIVLFRTLSHIHTKKKGKDNEGLCYNKQQKEK